MTHPLIPQIIDVASPIAEELGLEIVDVVFQTNKRPPVLRLDIRNLNSDTGLDDCERMSRHLEQTLDTLEIIPGSYSLEISSPGTSRQLTSEREFIAFKGFAVIVTTDPPYEGQKEWRGNLHTQDETAIYIHQKGRAIAIPRLAVTKVNLDANR
ncbi:ribosome maturation factor RimP [Aphanothece hegewaldii CCALA 016]|uniref:Ribosome maturation factor RimP n=1 Tax=Aphanothece hegewaldii CCALA 016 TaxID=2107694 RepID=A0A2T1M2Z9_9CHRO|nr:ribosome maturation factor RimP [Aphanothece hegewaldii]PSF39119.1 ribosome maturation factor RimP [Aphanothece hegewaldii CCALA 016]